ncbi:MAG: ribbon-helix-helix protein, CopG family [Oscillospiraceae bacterium]|nr:ribbon-helix-helix protein, CopG family [Oscillospiraceae bacterium]
MARPQKPNKSVAIRMDIDLYERLNDYCERSGQSKTTAIERALAMFIDDYDEKQARINGRENK